jgi:hypothetical protein
VHQWTTISNEIQNRVILSGAKNLPALALP